MTGEVGWSGSSNSDPSVIYLGNPTGISAYCDQQTDAANTFLLRLGDAVVDLTPPTIEPQFPDVTSAPAISVPTPPTMTTIVWTAPNAPDAFTGTLDVNDLLPAPFEDDPPELIFGAAPTFSETAPDAPGIDTSYEMPELSLTLPAAPDLLSISVTPFDGLNIPEIDFEVPELTVEAPSIREYEAGADYTSALLTALQTNLQNTIENGGTGLDADVENAIWDRGREREARSRADAIRGLDKMEEMGFALPPGAYVDARIKIETESDFVNRGLSREIMIKQAELALATTQHALTTAVNLEGKLIDYSNAVEQRLFDSCKYATEAGIAIYNARVQAYAAYVDAYKARVNIYEAQIRAEVARVDAYRAQIEAETAKAQINKALVDMYRTQVDAALANVEVFKARIGAIQARAEIEKNKILIFGEQVKAYASRVQAYTAGVEGYRATIMAEGAKQEAFKSQVDAYAARVGAGVKTIEARIAAFRANLDANVSQWDAYKSAYQAEAAKAQALATGNSSLAEAYKAEVSGVSSYNETLTKQWQAGIELAGRIAEVGIQAAKANAELYVTVRQSAIEAAKVGAQVSAQLGAAALNAINWSTSYNNSNAWGVSTSYSRSVADSESSSYSESYNENYNYSASV
jgi:hypothetical protein